MVRQIMPNLVLALCDEAVGIIRRKIGFIRRRPLRTGAFGIIRRTSSHYSANEPALFDEGDSGLYYIWAVTKMLGPICLQYQ